ncbi:MAG: hypothetical protein JWO00_462, partial [Candidatus Parcubacteria bacterium]|nr:hypothetical protein [Candidatus Parcubacteria bacterium]
MPAPIALFVYNRLEQTRATVEALRKNRLAAESELIVFSDGPKDAADAPKVAEVRSYIQAVQGFKNIRSIERAENWGLARSIIAGVTEVLNRPEGPGSVIVMEDDLVTSPYFLQYMNDGLALYENESHVASIHGYIYPVKKPLPETFFLRGADCWGWATWKRAWNRFEPDGAKLLAELERRSLMRSFDLDGSYGFSHMLKRQISGQNNSWAIRWHASAFLAGMLTLYPGVSLVDNVGQGTSGTHKGSAQFKYESLESRPIRVGSIPI